MPKKKLTTLYIVRHGDVENPNDIIYGDMPLPLSKKGQGQIRKVARKLLGKDITALYSSPIKRTIESAEILSEALGVRPVQTSKRLYESEFGIMWQGTRHKDMDKRFPKSWSHYRKEPGSLKFKGVSMKDIAKRMKNAYTYFAKKHAGENIILVSHGDPIKLGLLELEQRDLNELRDIPCRYACLIEVKFEDGEFIEYTIKNEGVRDSIEKLLKY